jgi:hypothetical protein
VEHPVNTAETAHNRTDIFQPASNPTLISCMGAMKPQKKQARAGTIATLRLPLALLKIASLHEPE